MSPIGETASRFKAIFRVAVSQANAIQRLSSLLYSSALMPFTNRFPRGAELARLITTKMDE